MDTVKFKKGLLYKIERFLFSHVKEAIDTCTLRSRWLKIIFLSPIMLLNWIYLSRFNNWSDGNTNNLTIISLLLKGITFIIVFIVITAIVGGINEYTIKTLTEALDMNTILLIGIISYLFSSSITLISFAIPIFISGLIVELIMYIKKKRDLKKVLKHTVGEETKDPIFKTIYNSLKDKYCNKIEWIEK